MPSACAKTLADLKLEYLDLYLIHWPVATNCTGAELTPSVEETWGAMEALQSEGKVRSIGVSNWSAKKLAAMRAHAKVFPAVNQVELHPVTVALSVWSKVLEERDVIFWIDNEAARFGLIKGTSPVPESRTMIEDSWDMLTLGAIFAWFARVPSSGNPADAPSRLVIDELISEGFVQVSPILVW